MRASKAPPRDVGLAQSSESKHGEALFAAAGCNTCHAATLVTAPTGTVLPDGKRAYDTALDRLMQREGLSYEKVQDGRNKLRTSPLCPAAVLPRLTWC